MNPPSDGSERDDVLDRIIGLGESSVRKTYYPELQRRMEELERFRALLDQTHDLIFLMSTPEGVVLEANAFALRQLGYRSDEIVGKTLEGVLRAEDTAEIRRFFSDGENGKEVLIFQFRRRDGSDFPAELTLSRVDFEGKMYGVAVCRDITERREAEEAALKAEVLARTNRELEGRVRERTIALARANELLKRVGQHGEKLTYQSRLQAERYRDYHIRLKKIIRLSKAIIAERTVEGVLNLVVDSAREVIGTRYAVAGHGFVNDEFAVDAVSRHEASSPCPPGRTFVVERGGVYLEIVEKVKPLRLTDEEFRRHPRYIGVPEGHASLRGLLGAPITDAEGKPRGFIMVSDKLDGTDFTEEDESLLQEVSSIASLGIGHVECVAGVGQHVAPLHEGAGRDGAASQGVS